MHPNAATTLARRPRARPAAIVKSAPVPGEATTISVVTRNPILLEALSINQGGTEATEGDEDA